GAGPRSLSPSLARKSSLSGVCLGAVLGAACSAAPGRPPGRARPLWGVFSLPAAAHRHLLLVGVLGPPPWLLPPVPGGLCPAVCGGGAAAVQRLRPLPLRYLPGVRPGGQRGGNPVEKAGHTGKE